jgi:phage terminase small subunit
MSELSQKELKAIASFMRGKTKAASLLDAGYSETVARTDAKEVFDRPRVKAEIEKRQKAMAKRAEVDADWVVARLKMIAEANLGDLLEFDEEGVPNMAWEKLTPEMKYALGGLKVRKYQKGRGKNATPVTEMQPRLLDKLRALEMLGRHLGMFEDKLKVEGELSLIEKLHAGRARAAARKETEDNDVPER